MKNPKSPKAKTNSQIKIQNNRMDKINSKIQKIKKKRMKNKYFNKPHMKLKTYQNRISKNS